MQLIYINKGASPTKFESYLQKYNNKVQQQGQKYNQLLMEGFVHNGAEVISISSRPINRAIEKKLFFRKETDFENGIKYHYVSFINYPVLRNFTVLVNVFFKILFMKKKRNETVVLCDALNIAASSAAWLASKLSGLYSVAVVTDVPCHRPDNAKIPFHEKVNLWLMKKFDGYLLLTEQMSDIVNPKKRPYVVLEGHSDVSMAEVENSLENKYEKKVCFYAGTLRKVYGIEYLVRGFIKANIPDSELHIYGDGDFREELKKLAEEYSSVKYMGIAPNSVIVENELKSTLLVNPRPTDADYTKYSFPSKNMEYMASGTPVLTTRLPGMPAEYNDYVYLIEDESTEGVCAALESVMKLSREELHEKGGSAKAFVMENKNNCIQAGKVLEMIKQEVIKNGG